MHLAVLMSNTDTSAFADEHPKDGEKFAQLMTSVRPTWTVTSFDITQGIFPPDLTAFDGVIITGSPASVHDDAGWIARLDQTIRDGFTAKVPLFGACFGHQAIAKALGGKVERNPDGWVFGVTDVVVNASATWASILPKTFSQYAAHNEQVTVLPKDAKVLLTSDACPTAGFAIGTRVYTTQNHPEMTQDFIAALVSEYSDKLPGAVAARAQASLARRADVATYAETIARFFEQA